MVDWLVGRVIETRPSKRRKEKTKYSSKRNFQEFVVCFQVDGTVLE